MTQPVDRVFLRDANGAAFSVEAPEAEGAIAGGEFRLETPEEAQARITAKERGTLGQQALLAGEKFARGATFGLSEAAAVGLLGDEYAQAAREREAVNPTLATVAEIGGAIAPTLLSGGAGAAGTAARLSPAALAGRLGAGAERVAAKALGTLGGEGALMTAARQAIKSGAGAATEAGLYGLGTSLADSSLEGVDWTAERALSGMGEGALFGLVGGGAVGGGVTLAKKVAQRAAKEVVDGMASGGLTFRKAVENWAEERAAGTIAGKGADDADDLLRKLSGSGDDPARLERIRKKFAESGMETGSRGEVASVAKSEAAIATARHAEIARDLIASGAKPDASAIGNALAEASRSIGETGAAKRVQAFASSRPSNVADAEKLLSKIEATVDWARKTQSTALPELERLSATVSAKIDDVAEGVPEVAGAWKQARQDARDWRTLAQRVGKTELTDAEVGKLIGVAGSVASIATGSILPMLGGAVVGQNPAVRQFVRQRGGEALGWLASKTGWVERTVRSSARRLAGHSPSDALAEAVGGATAQPGKARPVASATFAATRTPEAVTRDYDATTKQLTESQRDPQAMIRRLASTVAPIATAQPEVASAMLSRMVGDYQFLASKLPPPPDAMAMLTKGGPPNISRVEQEKFLRYSDALNDPPATIAGLAAGKINWEGADALKARRPILWDSFRTHTLMAVAAAPEPLAYKRKVYLSLLFDIQLDPSLQPAAAATMPVSPLDQPAPGNSPGSPTQLNAQKIGQEMATPAQISAA